MKTDIIKGFNDYTGEEAKKRAKIKKILIDIFERYGFEPAETPIIEKEEFVEGDNQEDEAISDIYRLKDKGNRKLALRYEFTFQLKRLMKNKKLPYRRYQIGPVFRDEPTSNNRFRQFIQCDADIIGTSNISSREEAELLRIAGEFLTNLGLEPFILINNRKLLNEILDFLKIKEKDKKNVLKEIDKYDKIPEKEIINNLKQYNAEKIIPLFKKGESFFKNFKSYKEIISLMDYCRIYNLKVQFAPTVVRGLSYYNGSIFEIKTKGIKETIVAGGSYIINNIQSTGISFGLDRIAILSKIKIPDEKFLIVSLEQDRKAIELVQKLRMQGKSVSIYYGKPSKALEYANSYKINKVIFIGQKEIQKKKFKIKNMKTGKEIFFEISKLKKI